MSETPVLDEIKNYIREVKPSSSEFFLKLNRTAYNPVSFTRKHGIILPDKTEKNEKIFVVVQPYIVERETKNKERYIDTDRTLILCVSQCAYDLASKIKYSFSKKETKKLKELSSIIAWLNCTGNTYRHSSSVFNKTTERVVKLYMWSCGKDSSKETIKQIVETTRLIMIKDKQENG